MKDYVPTILLHILYPDSRKVGFGWVLFLLASYGAFFAKHAIVNAAGVAQPVPLLDASNWLICVAISSGLIGGGTIADAKHELEMAKLDALGGKDAPAPVVAP